MTKNPTIETQLTTAKNPLLMQDYNLIETRLVEAYAREVQLHHFEMKPNDEGLWVALSLHDIMKSNHYATVREGNKRLMERKLVSQVKDWDGEEGFIKNFRMGKGDAVLFACIPTGMIGHYLELAALPYMQYAIRFRSEWDRPLYLLCDAIEKLANRTFPTEVEVCGVKLTLYPSPAKNREWSFVMLADLVNLLRIRKDSYFFVNESFDFGAIKRRILSPRFEFLTSCTDLHCELSNKQGPVKVTGIDIRAMRQAGNVSSTPIPGFSEYKLWDKR